MRIFNIIAAILYFSCTHMDYKLQLPAKLDPKKVDSPYVIEIRDDEITKENTYPSLYMYFYVNDFLIHKDYKKLSEKDRYQGKFYASFEHEGKIRHGTHWVKIVLHTYRDNKPTVLTFKKKAVFSPEHRVHINFNKTFKLKIEKDFL